MTTILEVRNLSKTFGGLKAVDGVNFQLNSGEILALIGPNGAGKSTCFNMLMGQLEPTVGSVWLAGENITGLSPRQIWRQGVGRTFQVAATYSSMTVVENVQMALLSHNRRVFSMGAYATRQFRNEAIELLELVGMSQQSERHCAVLSYGDLKRLEFAIALANSPKLLLMDEPTAGMAPKERISLMRLIVEVVKNRNVSVLFTEHDMDVVFGYSHRIIVLNHGKLIAEGTSSDIQNNPLVQEVYLGGGVELDAYEVVDA